VSKPSYVHSEIINGDLVMVKGARQSLLLNKPVFAGFAILELSKLTMYQFHYDYILPKYGPDKARLLFTDTDSLTYHIKTENLHDDMKDDMDKFDTSNFPQGHRLRSMDNHRVVGKFKSETAEVAPKQFVGLRSKMYSLYVGKEKPTKTALKGIAKSYVKKHVCHQAFLKTLLTKQCTTAQFLRFRSVNHEIKTWEITKICLSAFDDKRYLENDGIHSLAYGHKDIPTRKVDVSDLHVAAVALKQPLSLKEMCQQKLPKQPKSLFDICLNKMPVPLPEKAVDVIKLRRLRSVHAIV
jgi:hypothetical protein